MKKSEITIAKLASKIAKVEGRKHEASIGDVREILRILSDMIAGELAVGGKAGVSSIESCLWEDSRRRYEKLRKKKKKMN